MTEQLWEPFRERVESTNLYRFVNAVNAGHGLGTTGYDALHRWSVENISDF